MDSAPIKSLFADPLAGLDPQLVLWQAVIAAILATLLGMCISYTYKQTHKGGSYTQTFSHVLIIMTVVVSLVMIAIGSNIARAFSLVGALSIIRYRTAVKDARDTAFVFFAMMVGISCGVGLRGVAIFATFFISALIWLLGRTKFGQMTKDYALLRLAIPSGLEFEKEITPYLRERAEDLSLLSTETIRQGTALEVTYRLSLASGVNPTELIEELKRRNGNEKIHFYPATGAAEEN